MEQIAHWTKATKNWEWNSGVCVLFRFFCFVFVVFVVVVFPGGGGGGGSSFFSFSKIMQSKAEIIWSYYHLSSEDRNKKNV